MLRRTKQVAKWLRDQTVVGNAVAGLLKLGRYLGVHFPVRLTRHLPYRGIVVVKVAGGRAFKMRSRGHVIENSMYWRGLEGHEPECTNVWCDLASRANVILDVGANTGLYSLLAATVNPEAQVVAFEPVSRIAEIARENVCLNVGMAIEVVEMAVGSEVGEIELHDPGGEQPSSASLIRGFVPDQTVVRRVPITTVDRVADELSLSSIDLAKIDVEGVEERVLEGMRKVIQKDQPSLLLEVLDSRPGLSLELERLRRYGYRLFDCRKDGLVELETSLCNHLGRNILAVSKKWSDTRCVSSAGSGDGGAN